MKLVTGIEAIQSGKNIRQHLGLGNVGVWHKPDKDSFYSFISLTTPCFEIEQEPREFWINLEGIDRVYEVGTSFNPNGNPKYIKVREVLE